MKIHFLVYAVLVGAVVAFLHTVKPYLVVDADTTIDAACFLEGGHTHRVYRGATNSGWCTDVPVPPGKTYLFLWMTNKRLFKREAEWTYRMVRGEREFRGNFEVTGLGSGMGLFDVGTPAEGEHFSLEVYEVDRWTGARKPTTTLGRFTYREKEKRRANE